MHDCTKTKERMTELLLDHAESPPDETLAVELRRCSACREEFDERQATLRLTTRLREASSPAESYWPSYHSRLRQKLLTSDTVSGPSLLMRILRSSVSVPVPVGAAVIIALSMLFVIAMRPRPLS